MQTAKRIFVNLPVSDLSKSVKFFTGIGFAFDDQFTGGHAACMIIGENMFAMLLVEEFFREIHPGQGDRRQCAMRRGCRGVVGGLPR